MKLTDLNVTDYLKLVDSDAPAPGGGSASALCGAQGAGLLAMAAKLTVGKEKYAAFHAVCAAVIAEADDLCGKLTAQIDRDTEAYNRIAAAFRLPRGDETQTAARKREIAAATVYAAEVPLETMRLAMRGLQCAERLAGHFNTNCASDVGCGIEGLLCCIHGAHLNVQINVGGMAEAAALRAEADEIAARADALCKELMGQIRACL